MSWKSISVLVFFLMLILPLTAMAAVSPISTNNSGNVVKRPLLKPPLKVESKKFTVQGEVQNRDGTSSPGLTVKAFDCNTSKEEMLLGQAITDEQGSYSISYTEDQLKGKSAADLVVKVYRDDALLLVSDIIFGAAQQTTKDFTLPASESPEFQRLSGKIKPLLRNQVN